MKSSTKRLIAALCAGGLFGTGVAHATLVGDTVTVGHYSEPMTFIGDTPPATFAVQAGNADQYTWYWSYPFAYQVNVEAGSIHVDFSYMIGTGQSATWTDSTFACGVGGCSAVPVNFNGLAVTDLNDSSGDPLQSVVVSTNMAGWDSSRLSFGGDYVRFDWKGLSFTQDTYLDATLTFAQTAAPVPEPEIYAMIGLGLGLLGWARRRSPKH